MSHFLMAVAGSVFALGGLCGCSSDQVPTYPVSGKVTFPDGEPVRTGHIEFESVDHGTTASGRIQEDGTYVVGTYTPDDGAAAGPQRVMVLQMIINDGSIKHTKDHGAPVDPRYNRFESSGLTANVSDDGANEIAIEVTRQASSR